MYSLSFFHFCMYVMLIHLCNQSLKLQKKNLLGYKSSLAQRAHSPHLQIRGMAGSQSSQASTCMFCLERKVFGPPSSVSHELQNQRRDGGMEGSPPPPPPSISLSLCPQQSSKSKPAGVKKSVKKKQKTKEKISVVQKYRKRNTRNRLLGGTRSDYQNIC